MHGFKSGITLGLIYLGLSAGGRRPTRQRRKL